MSSSPFHHFAFNHGTRKIAPLKVRNPSISPSQIMPSPSGVPFNIADMPWSYSGKPGQLMEFNAVIRPSPILQGPLHHSLPYSEMRKRKTEPDVVPIPSKQFFTDESMAIHMNNLHLSTEYTSHNIETTTSAFDDALGSLSASPSSSSLDDDMSLGEAGPSTSTSRVYMSPQELEERLKKAQRITLCEEVRKLDNRTEILPQVLLERIEKPCTALVLWQPPQVLEKILTKVNTALKEREERDHEQGKQQQQESTSRRPNEVAMGEDDEPLPDLPDYDDDLDFEENNNNVATVSDMNSMDVEM